MASDEIIWGIIDKQFCSYKLKTTKGQNFCHNEYNVSGFCSRQACPLANSRYATVRANPETGRLYLYMKTVERAHLPSKLWERIRLSPNYAEALKQIDDRLIYWPKFLTHKCKQRLTRLTQVAIRMRRIAKEEERLGERLVPKLAPKVRTRERARERKAEAAAHLETVIERQLLERLRSGAYGQEPLNVSEVVWKKVLKAMEREGAGSRDKDRDRGIESEAEEEEEEEELEVDEMGEKVQASSSRIRSKARMAQAMEEEEDDESEMMDEDDLSGQVEYVSDLEESEDELNDIEDWIGENRGVSDSEDDDEDEDDEDDDEDDEDEDDNDDSIGKKKKRKGVVGDKRKRGRVTRLKPKKKLAIKEKLVAHRTSAPVAF